MTISDISGNLVTGLTSLLPSITKYLSAETRDVILGDTLSQLMKRGTGKTLISLAVHADALRMLFQVISADGEIGEEEMAESRVFLQVVARAFAKVRAEYANFADLSKDQAASFLAKYRHDKGTFGFRDTSTEWSGIQICRNVATHYSDDTPLNNLRDLFVNAAAGLASIGGVTTEEKHYRDAIAALFQSVNVSEAESDDEYRLECDYSAVQQSELANHDSVTRAEHNGRKECHVTSTEKRKRCSGMKSEPNPSIADEFEIIEEFLQKGMMRSETCSMRKQWVTETAPMRISAWRAAAESGDPLGQVLYGCCFHFAAVVEDDPEQAAAWFKRAAEQGIVHAQYSLGEALAIMDNPQQAMLCFRLNSLA